MFSALIHAGLMSMFRPGISAHGEMPGVQLTVYLAPSPPQPELPVSTTPVMQAGEDRPAPIPQRSAAPAEAHAPSSPHPGETEAIPSAAPQESRYYLSSEVDVKARPIYLQPLVYPERAYYEKIAGRVKLRIHIDVEGKIDAVDVVEAEPAGIFEEAALKALLNSRFAPALKNGRSVPSEKLLEITLDPYENTSKAAP